jgi:GYF domain 2
VKELPRDFEGDDEVTRMADAGALAGALAGAFTQAFSGAPTPESDAPLSMPGDEWFVGINGVPVGPIRLSELRSKAATGAVNKESLVWRDGFEDWRPLKTYPELLAIVEEGVSSARASLTPFIPSGDVKATTGTPAVVTNLQPAPLPSPSAVTGSAVVTDDLSALALPRRGTSPMVWVAMVIAIGLGLTLGFVIFGGNKEPETRIVEKIVEKEVPAKDSQAPVAANEQPGETVIADPQAPKKTGPSTGKAPSATPAATEEKPNTGLKGLSGLTGLGPSSGPASGGPSGATAGGSQLDGGQIQSTVSRYTGSVKRRCWQPALDARAKDAPMTAKVTVTITVSGTGSVQNATTSAEPRGYPGLANCIVSSVRSWQFPASGGTTIANVPFVFAGQ